MKLNRLAGILAALMLLMSAFGAMAEEPAAQPGVPLYIVLTDCGWTLYGEEKPSENSVVPVVGDPEGLALSFAEGALTKLAEPEAQIMILGYNDRLRFAENIAPVSVQDQAAVGAQAQALRGLAGRQSSLLNVALEELSARIGAFVPAYDVRLMIISGGAVNYGSADAMNKAIGSAQPPLAQVQGLLDGLRANGVKVSSYVWDLAGSGRVPAEHPGKDALVLTEAVMGENCAMITGGNGDEMIAGLCDAVLADLSSEEYGAPLASPLSSADMTALKSNDAAVVRGEDNHFEAYIGENFVSALSSRQKAAAAGDIVRLYSAVNVTEQDRMAIEIRKMDALVAGLDGNGDGTLDAVAEVNAAATVLPVNEIANYTFTVDAPEALSVSADAAANTLSLTALKAGEVRMTIATADGSVSRELKVGVADYSVVWNLDDGAVIYAGEETTVASCADQNNVMTGTVNGEQASAEGSALTIAPAQAGDITVSVSVAGRESETRSFKVYYKLAEGEDARNITLRHPYYGVQEQQTVRVSDVNGGAVDLSGFTASESALAEVYFNEDEDAALVVPKAAGAETITLTHAVSGQTITLNLTVESLYSMASFWLSAVGAPVCLIGLTAMIVLLIVKLGGKRR